MEMDRKEAKKQILVSIIISYWPSYEQFENPDIKPYGHYNGSYGKWVWDRMALKELKLFKLYDIIRLVAPDEVFKLSLRIKDL
jgi:hypothetical protein